MKRPLSLRGIENLKLRKIPVPLQGVYFLVKDNIVIYVGQSTDILLRIKRKNE